MIPRSPADFDIAIICALPVEFDAVEAVFDEHYDSAAYEKQHGDANFYRTGRIHQHNVVLSCLPEMGKRSAASVASSLQCTFTNIYLTLLVGICGGVPFLLSKIGETELILGDVIISSSIVEYDFGKQYPDKFQSKPGSIDTIGRDRRIRSFLTALKTSQLHNEFQRKLSAYLASLQGSDRRWNYPGAEHDRLYETTYRHKHHHPGSGMNCICDASQVNQDPVCDEALESDCSKLGCSGVLLKRSRLSSSDHSPQIHFGILGSGDTVMKSGEHRDELAKTAQIIGFEMEGAGVADSLSCLIIKGICDYADSHKNKMWQQYAAASAASCCKAFLEALPKIKQRSAPSFDEYEGTASEVGVIGSSERLASVFLDGTSASQHDYQWDFSSIAPDISDMEHHLSALQKELHRVKGDLANPLIKSVLVSGLTQAAKNNPNFLHRSHGIESFRLSHYNTKFGKIVSRTRIDRETIRAVQDGESCTHYKTTTSFNFHPASWLIKIGFKYGLETMITSSRAGWQYNILSVRAVPDDALVFDFCKVGNVDAVRELFGRGDASVLDVDSRGWRPLHFATRFGHPDLVRFLIIQGADRAASEYNNNRTPASFIYAKEEAIELLRLFDDCIDLSEPDSEGWEIFDSAAEDKLDSEEYFIARVISFFLQKYKQSIIDCGFYEPPIRYITGMSIIGSLTESVQLLLDLDPQTGPFENILSTKNSYTLEKPLVFDVVEAPQTRTDVLRILMDKGADIHTIYCDETPTSLSLYFSYTFLRWLGHLQDIYQELDDFVRCETMTTCILERSGWHASALRTLFSLKPCETRHYTVESNDLHMFGASLRCEEHSLIDDVCDGWAFFIEPWWEELKYNMKSNQCVCFMLEEGGMYLDKRQFHDHGTCKEDSQTMSNVQACKRNGDSSRVLEDFYCRGGVWQFHYEPGEIWCQICLAEREGSYETSSEDSDAEDSGEDTDTETSNGEEEEEGDDDASDMSIS